MTYPKTKAKELVEKFSKVEIDNYGNFRGLSISEAISEAKRCALITCEECMNIFPHRSQQYLFWQETKSEIEKL